MLKTSGGGLCFAGFSAKLAEVHPKTENFYYLCTILERIKI
jgi:hypothetical protein